jgi:hypothetical protein
VRSRVKIAVHLHRGDWSGTAGSPLHHRAAALGHAVAHGGVVALDLQRVEQLGRVGAADVQPGLVAEGVRRLLQVGAQVGEAPASAEGLRDAVSGGGDVRAGCPRAP